MTFLRLPGRSASTTLAGGYVPSVTDPEPVVIDTPTPPEPGPTPSVTDPEGPQPVAPDPKDHLPDDAGDGPRADGRVSGGDRGGENPDPFWLTRRTGSTD